MEFTHRTSRLPGFYDLPVDLRLNVIAKVVDLDPNEQDAISQSSPLPVGLADSFIENAIGTFSLPLGIATNFLINGEEILIPMAVEESSVVAAASHGAKLARHGGGFMTASSDPIMTGQIQVYLQNLSPDLGPESIDAILAMHKEALLHFANKHHQNLVLRGGGAQNLTWYRIPEIHSLVIKLHVNTCDAMGANIVNTMCEDMSYEICKLFPGAELGLRILTNLTDHRMARASCSIPVDIFHSQTMSGERVTEKIVKAWEFAWFDIYRAATHNKGVMNGIDPVVIATGNDWRAVEAGAHAHAARSGVYRPMTTWSIAPNGNLEGSIELPMAVGTVGGVTKLHPTTRSALKILGRPNARRLGEICCAVGLAQNLSALRALASEGIQQGHMNLHQKNSRLHKQNLI